MKKAEFTTRVSETTPFDSEAELEAWIKKTEAEIKRKQRKDQGLEDEPEEEPVFPLVDRPDEELTEEEIKEKRRQKLMKAGWDARVKLREEKRKEKERREEERRQEELFRATDPAAWSARLRAEQEVRIVGQRGRSSCFRLLLFAWMRGRKERHNWVTESLSRRKLG